MRERRMHVSVAALLAMAVTAIAAFVLPGAATSATNCKNRSNNNYDKLLECVTLEGVRAHQAAFQRIADANNGDRAAGTKGYADSVAYVRSVLRDAGYRVTLDEFQFVDDAKTVLQQLTPVNAAYASGAFTNSGLGDVTRSVTAVDINLVPPRASTSGCEAADFAGFPAGNIALIQRGTCTFAVKAENAQAAGASAVVIFNQGNTPDREGLIVGTVDPFQATIPVVGGSFANGEALSQAGSTARVRVAESTDVNVIADSPGGKNKNNIVMAGAHLDSVPEGPGINDNGSGSAALLETAVMMAKITPTNRVRYAWWGAEELGLIGSTDYVDNLPAAELDKIAMYMNYDMVGSPNYIPMVYDSDESTFPAPDGLTIPAGSTAIEDVYESYYTLVGEPYDDTEFSGRSDYEAFIFAGIPSGGLFTGAEEPKTAAQQAIWGGTTGAQLDPCYHAACDTFGNNNAHILELNADLIAYAQLTFAYSTQSVNGVAGTPVPGKAPPLPAPAGPEGTWEP